MFILVIVYVKFKNLKWENIKNHTFRYYTMICNYLIINYMYNKNHIPILYTEVLCVSI